MTPAAGPDGLSWAAATFRGLHPLRWGLALGGLAATVLVAAGLQAFWEGQPPQLVGWLGNPVAQAEELSDHLAERSFAGLVVRLGVLFVVLAAVWAVVGGWIARHELVARHKGQPYATPEPLDPGPTRLVSGRLKTLVISAVPILVIGAVLLIPVAVAGLLNRLGGIGAILVALVLPVVLVADLLLLLIAVGAVAWPLMPITTAAENSDVFDALSRSYNYLYQRPVRFVLLTVVTLTLSAAPTAVTLFALAGPIENWPAAAGHPAVWIAAGLSVSIFWSVQTLAYLQLRAAVDETDASEIAGAAEANVAATPKTPPEKEPTLADLKAAAPRPGPVGQFLIFGLMVVTWVLTAWLFAQVGGENAGWLGWGLGGHFMPPAQGLYYGAALLAGAWGFVWLAAPILVLVRGRFGREAEAVRERPTGPAGGDGSAESLLK